MKLYEYATTRSVRCHWMLRELGVEYESETIDLSAGEGQSSEFLKMNPFGRIPVLEDDDFILFESAAICMYLADKYPEKGLLPKAGTQDRALCKQWLFFATTELEGPLWFNAKNRFLYPEELRSPEITQACRFDFERVISIFDSIVAQKKFIVGDSFSVADLMISHILYWAYFAGWLDEHKHSANYLKRHIEREAFPRHLYGD